LDDKLKAREIQRKSRWGRRSDRTIVDPVNANYCRAWWIQYNNLFYECDPDIASGARVFGRTTCEARIDDNCVDYIYVDLIKIAFSKALPA
jgi:hypothetical protein